MDERMRFVLACEDGIFSVSELCARVSHQPQDRLQMA
jgi:hypothetical protein